MGRLCDEDCFNCKYDDCILDDLSQNKADGARKNKYSKKYYEARKSKGLCIRCSKPTTSGILCEKCKEKQKVNYKKWYNNKKTSWQKHYQKCKLNHRCPRCGALVETGVLCKECASKNNARVRKLHNERKAKGLCTLCGSPAETGTTLCERCRARSKEYYKKHKGRKK